MNLIAQSLENLTLGVPLKAGSLAMFPLLSRNGGVPAYDTLDEALARGDVRISEVSSAGSVPELTLENKGARPVLVVDGEELIGAKQNRIVNVTLLAPARERLTVPVSCVEHGRWNARSQHFSSSERSYYAKGRAITNKSVTESLHATGKPRSAQGEVWRDIDAKAARMAAASDTSAMAAIYERRKQDLEELESRLPSLPTQSGAVFAIDGRIVGMDLFDTPDTWRRLAPKLLKGYGLDALDQDAKPGAPRSIEAADVTRWLKGVSGAPSQAFETTGLGHNVRLTGHNFTGAALVFENRMLHLAAFDQQVA